MMQTETKHMADVDEVALLVAAEHDFNIQYAEPLCQRHALLKTATNYAELAPAMESDWAYLAELAADFYCYRLAKRYGQRQPLQTTAMLTALERGLRDHYRSDKLAPQIKPHGGDLIKDVPEWRWGKCQMKPGDLGVLGGIADDRNDGGSVTFNASAHLGKGSKYSTGSIGCSCSGGPATVWTDATGMQFSGFGAVRTFWRWRGMPEANGGLYYKMAAPVWNADLNYRSN